MESQKHFVRGWDAYGKPVEETVEIEPFVPPTLRQRAKALAMRFTPWWAWNWVWYRTGATKFRMVGKIMVWPK